MNRWCDCGEIDTYCISSDILWETKTYLYDALMILLRIITIKTPITLMGWTINRYKKGTTDGRLNTMVHWPTDSAFIWFARQWCFKSKNAVFLVDECSFFKKNSKFKLFWKLKYLFITLLNSNFDIIWKRGKRENNQETYQT